MGSVGGLLGLGGGAGGTGFSTNPGTNAGQLQTAYNRTQNSLDSQENLMRALQGQGGLQNESNVYGQLQNVVSGQGPNPAQAMLNQATGANIANQAALMAGQRGAGANVGLMARQAAQTGAGLQQQAAGQGASMQAQQSLGALGQAGNMANTMAANQIGESNAITQAHQNEQNILQGANTANNQIQGQLANTTMQGQQGLVGGLMNSAGAAFGLAKGGNVPGYADGGSAFGPQSMFAQSLNSVDEPSPQSYSSSNPGAESLGKVQMHHAKPAKDPMTGAQNIAPSGYSAGPDMGTMVGAKGGNVGSQLKKGGHVPGQAKEAGNSYKNDTVKALLSPGEIVIPRSVLQSKDPIRGSAEFVRSVMAKKGRKA